MESLPNSMFRVELEDGSELVCHVSGELRAYLVQMLPGDKVTVKRTPFDDKRGRIVSREKE